MPAPDAAPAPICATCTVPCPGSRGWGRCPRAPLDILGARMGDLEERFRGLARRAAKLGCPAPRFEIVTEYTRLRPRRDPLGFETRGFSGGDLIKVVQVYGAAPSFAGWTLAATLSPIELPTGWVNLIRAVPAAGELPESFRTSGTYCDHCKTSRRRAEVFVVRHEDGRTMQVGRQCIRDFLGHAAPESVAAMFEFYASVADGLDDGEGGWGLGRSAQDYSLVEYLGLVVRETKENGWLSRTAAREQGRDGASTADGAMARLRPPFGSPRRPELPNEEELTRARSALAWACALEPTSDYEHNIHAVALTGSVEGRTLGLAASIWVAYERAMSREVERRKRAASVSTHQGTVGGKLANLILTVEKVVDLESEWGASHLHIMRDEAGNSYKWFATSERLDPGDVRRVSGTVKKHEEYKGVKATLLTRCGATDPYTGFVQLTEAQLRLLSSADLAGVTVDGRLVSGRRDALLALHARLVVKRDGFSDGRTAKSAAKAAEALGSVLASVLALPEGVVPIGGAR